MTKEVEQNPDIETRQHIRTERIHYSRREILTGATDKIYEVLQDNDDTIAFYSNQTKMSDFQSQVGISIVKQVVTMVLAERFLHKKINEGDIDLLSRYLMDGFGHSPFIDSINTAQNSVSAELLPQVTAAKIENGLLRYNQKDQTPIRIIRDNEILTLQKEDDSDLEDAFEILEKGDIVIVANQAFLEAVEDKDLTNLSESNGFHMNRQLLVNKAVLNAKNNNEDDNLAHPSVIMYQVNKVPDSQEIIDYVASLTRVPTNHSSADAKKVAEEMRQIRRLVLNGTYPNPQNNDQFRMRMRQITSKQKLRQRFRKVLIKEAKAAAEIRRQSIQPKT